MFLPIKKKRKKIKSTNTEAANFAKLNLCHCQNTFGNGCTYSESMRVIESFSELICSKTHSFRNVTVLFTAKRQRLILLCLFMPRPQKMVPKELKVTVNIVSKL